MTGATGPSVRRTPLTRVRVLETGRELIDEVGLGRFTMRALGARLGVEAMSIYKHVPSKQAVLDGVVELLLNEFEVDWRARTPSTRWQVYLQELARALRELAVTHPQAFPLLSHRTQRAYIVGRSVTEQALTVLIDAGFDQLRAIAALRLTVRFTLGFVLSHPAPVLDMERQHAAESLRDYPLVAGLAAEVHNPDGETALFDYGLRLLIGGLERDLAASPHA